ncbi:MAG: family 43 glycosylhydrolase [Armatimonadetes bacterium]|nr:family 43 glycosylhydrolase [Armatimonadota bacterium]
MNGFHFRSKDRWIGDMIPFFWNDEYHLFYLPRAPEGRHCWGHIVSRNLLEWQELPDAIAPSNEPNEPDAIGCWTGSVVEHNGVFHCFYTGFNPQNRYPQTICHAVSDDLIHWCKDEANPILVPDERWYEPQDWRDPFVFFNSEVGEFWMLICARDKRVAFERRGCVALATSPDLQNWQVHEPLWSGSVCWAAECPDMFKLGNRWYLIYSHGVTRYRWIADWNTGQGTWDKSVNRLSIWNASFPDTFDTEFVAAAKTLFDGKRQILFGWIWTLEGDSDFGARQWGGHMALPRELVPQPDGSLAVKLPEEFENWQKENANSLNFQSCETLCGSWQLADDSVTANSLNGVSVLRCDVPDDFFLSAKVIPKGEAVEFGFLLRMGDGKGHKIVVDKNRVALMHWSSWGDVEPRLSRPISWREGELVKIQLIVHGSIAEIFVGDKVSLASRIYEPKRGWLGFYAANGEVSFLNAKISPLSENFNS